jgi:prolyl-tRNA synthetase
VSVNARDPETQERVQSAAASVYDQLRTAGAEVLWDDRAASTGEKLADADLIGLPLRLVVSERSLKEDGVEWKLRNSSEAAAVKLADLEEKVAAFMAE